MENRLLIVTISSKPKAKLIPVNTNKVEIGDQLFEEIGLGDTNGFYDFLRQPDGHIVGVRFAPFIELAYIFDSAIAGSGLRITGAAPTASLELFWESVTNYDHDLSADQFFDYNYIFRSSLGRFAVSFGFSHLPQNDIDNLLSAVSKK